MIPRDTARKQWFGYIKVKSSSHQQQAMEENGKFKPKDVTLCTCYLTGFDAIKKQTKTIRYTVLFVLQKTITILIFNSNMSKELSYSPSLVSSFIFTDY